jgi:hypothetical protein
MPSTDGEGANDNRESARLRGGLERTASQHSLASSTSRPPPSLRATSENDNSDSVRRSGSQSSADSLSAPQPAEDIEDDQSDDREYDVNGDVLTESIGRTSKAPHQARRVTSDDEGEHSCSGSRCSTSLEPTPNKSKKAHPATNQDGARASDSRPRQAVRATPKQSKRLVRANEYGGSDDDEEVERVSDQKRAKISFDSEEPVPTRRQSARSRDLRH